MPHTLELMLRNTRGQDIACARGNAAQLARAAGTLEPDQWYYVRETGTQGETRQQYLRTTANGTAQLLGPSLTNFTAEQPTTEAVANAGDIVMQGIDRARAYNGAR